MAWSCTPTHKGQPTNARHGTSADTQSRKIVEQAVAFLKAGHKIQAVSPGATGLPSIKDVNRSYQMSIRGFLS
ncbi:hypothetical protein [Spartinivicinus ruber]|uniref:hypothetical protein n=1 Tax=Spartinivicinus ruber TaxID=2683272 RepID=UPI0013D8CCC0|nr:hypothetical protein [Spartinivicinus ruber]